jgi:AcrR family transcriptional regulator
VPSVPQQPPSRPRQLPRGRHGLPRALVVENQRERIFDSLAFVCAQHGYGEVTVQDITDHAGVSRRTFYDLFRDKEDCFLAAHDLVMDRLLRAVDVAYSNGDRPWTERMASALQAVIERFVAEPELARLVIVEVLAAGRVGLEHHDEALQRFAVFFEPAVAMLPAEMTDGERLTQAVIGGLYEALYMALVERQAREVRELVADLLYCVVVPYLGHQAALAASAAERVGGLTRPPAADPHAAAGTRWRTP